MKSDYTTYSDTPPGGFDTLFRPLSAEIKADIKEILDHIESCPEAGDLMAPFNRLMAELHIVTTSKADAERSRDAYKYDLDLIDKALDAAGVEADATVTRVRKHIHKSDTFISAVRKLTRESY